MRSTLGGGLVDRPRLESLTVRDFRSIAGEWTIPLDADVVLIHGQNGAGKTSLLSALELAATGTISYLDEVGDGNYARHLHHWGTPSGQVTLKASGLPAVQVGSALVTEGGADVDPLLPGSLADTFVERCFLPQATLGRLFEVYAPRGRSGAQNPLIRFVKEVLGLDALDALVDGLYSAAHVKRIEKLSQSWRETLERRDRLSAMYQEALSLRNAAKGTSDRLFVVLARRLGVEEDSPTSRDAVEVALSELLATRSAKDSESAKLHELDLRLDAVEVTLAQHELMALEPTVIERDNDLVNSEHRLSEWEASRSEPLRLWFANVAGSSGTATAAGPSSMLSAVRNALQGVEESLRQVRARVFAAEEAQTLFAATTTRLDNIDRELGALAKLREMAATSSAAAGLASLLTSLLLHVDGDECPVCNQEFVKGGTLRDHIVGRAQALSEDATKLLQLEQRRAQLESERETLALQRASLASLTDAAVREELAMKEQRLFSELRELRTLQSIAEVGALLAEEVDSLRDHEARQDRARSLLASCVADLNDVADNLRAEPPRGLMSQRLAALRAMTRSGRDSLEREHAQLADLTRLHEDYRVELDNLAGATESCSALGEELQRLDQQISEAKRRKEIASDLRKKTEARRTATITRVFDEQLNGSWARIFGALVPSEPFVPQFKRIPEGTRHISVEVQTIHQNGVQGATPAAMLSQGNLNTAALSLFVALHFAGSAELPWLIFDDPVQSMDDLHVANFAALVKQLTRRNGRQVVIAVHERELFEYLSMELAPASADERLLTVTLDRTYGRTVITPRLTRYKPDTALAPAPAA